MNRVDQLFVEKNRGILSVYYPAGYPNLDDTVTILHQLQEQGVDMVELGIPFSDPMADGVVIQEAANVALANGISLVKIFEQLKNCRDNGIKIPIILMGYLNPIMHYGFERFCKECKSVGVDGVIIPDLPFNEYIADYKSIAERYELKVIMFISPESSEERIKLIDENTSGFIYMVSIAGTTGAKNAFDNSTLAYFKRIEAMQLKNPRLIGFGISNSGTFKAAQDSSSGAIVGSQFVKLLKSEPSPKDAVKKLLDNLL